MEHQTGNGQEMQSGDHFRQAFVIVGHPSEVIAALHFLAVVSVMLHRLVPVGVHNP